jgi:hypothetical protein
VGLACDNELLLLRQASTFLATVGFSFCSPFFVHPQAFSSLLAPVFYFSLFFCAIFLCLRAAALSRAPNFGSEFWASLNEPHQHHYEQYGRFTGTVSIDHGTAVGLTAIGMRDHTCGHRSVPPSIFFSCALLSFFIFSFLFVFPLCSCLSVFPPVFL